MAYIGRQSGQIGNYIRCNTITPDGSTTTFALTNVLDNAAGFKCPLSYPLSLYGLRVTVESTS